MKANQPTTFLILVLVTIKYFMRDLSFPASVYLTLKLKVEIYCARGFPEI